MAQCKLTDATQNIICDHVRKDLPIKDACALAGINPASYYLWMKHAKEAQKQNKENIYTQFLKKVEQAESEAVQYHLDNIRDVAKNDKKWQASAWILERRRPLDFSANAEILREIKEFMEALSKNNQFESVPEQTKLDILAKVKELQSRDGQAIEQSNSKTD